MISEQGSSAVEVALLAAMLTLFITVGAVVFASAADRTGSELVDGHHLSPADAQEVGQDVIGNLQMLTGPNSPLGGSS